jgi:hypothetical protein
MVAREGFRRGQAFGTLYFEKSLIEEKGHIIVNLEQKNRKTDTPIPRKIRIFNQCNIGKI